MLTQKVYYQILRYCDDYHILTNNLSDQHEILKAINKVVVDLGMRLNTQKTKHFEDIILDTIKEDKIYWMKQKEHKNPLNQLLAIYELAKKHPNSGALNKSLENFFNKITNKNLNRDSLSLVSILANIAYQNPRAIVYVNAILGELLEKFDDKIKAELIDKIVAKFKEINNVEYMIIWLQRICLHHKYKNNIFQEYKLTKIACEPTTQKQIWESNWLKPEIQKLINSHQIISQEIIKNLPPRVPLKEFSLFNKANRYF